MKTSSLKTKRISSGVLSVALLLVSAPAYLFGQLINLGQPYSPAGANFSIYAVQDINTGGGGGSALGTQVGASVNQNFEPNGGLGVNYTSVDSKGKATTTAFGIGIYADAAKNTLATGLDYVYNAPVLASTASFVIADLDLKTGFTSFNTAKAAPTITLFNPDGTVYATATPAQVKPNMTFTTAVGNGKDDYWNVSIAGLLTTLGKADTAIGSIMFSAAAKNDIGQLEHVPSDPYFVFAAKNAVPVPEPSTSLAVGAVGILFLFRRRRKITAA